MKYSEIPDTNYSRLDRGYGPGYFIQPANGPPG